MITPEELLEFEKLEKAATPGSWVPFRCDLAEPHEACGLSALGGFDYSYDECHHPLKYSDAAFMDAAKIMAPRLINEVKILKESVEWFKFDAHTWRQRWLRSEEVLADYKQAVEVMAEALKDMDCTCCRTDEFAQAALNHDAVKKVLK